MSSELGSIVLPSQTRVYARDASSGAWEIGRLLDDHGDSQLVKFPNGKTLHLPVSSVFVRWARSIDDPTLFLGAGISETPRFADGRAPFVRSLLQQRSAALGMPALPSSAIELEAHQVEVVRKVLQDPIQRYLLADEVGLGKTIEAGVLIRQCVLDDRETAFIVVIVPDALVSQWRLELATKFFLEDLFDERVFVEAFSARARLASLLPKATMLVIDEAHHVTADHPGERDSLYDDLVEAAPRIERVLLLSATPALHNERGFLRMLHLLDPLGYPLDSEEAFRRRIESRQALAEIVATLTPQNALYLDYTLDQLSELFPEDARLQEAAGQLREILTRMPSDDDPELIDAVALVRDHLSEVYRLHRRVLRHRRRNVIGVTPDRAGLENVHYNSATSSRAADLAEDWRLAEIVGPDLADLNAASFGAALALAELRLGYGSPANDVGREPTLRGLVAPGMFSQAAVALTERDRMMDRFEALGAAIAARSRPKVQFIVFCSDPQTADALAASLSSTLGVPVDRHQPDNDTWRAFGDDPSRPVLVCDHRAEEGLNLQGGEKVVVHFDVPWNPNRIEQRLGRADRYGSGHAVKSLALCCDDDPLEAAWTRYLDEGLKVFDRSIASLQYLLEQTVKELPRLLLTEGVEGVGDLLRRDGGDSGRIEREIKSIDEQDALDALGAPSGETLDTLSELDDQWREIEADIAGWVETTLQMERAQDPSVRKAGAPANAPGGFFRYRYLTGNHHTLIPLDAFFQRCRPAIDADLRVPGSRDVWTTPYTYRRHSALSRQGRALRARVLRYGDPLLTGLREITQRDERGRSTAVWRHALGAPADAGTLHFRFDFVVEADVRAAARVLDLAGHLTASALSSICRRGDMGLPPIFYTVWLDGDFQEIHDEALLAALSKPYTVEARDQGGRDFNLNPKRWRILREMRLPYLEEWPEVCRTARTKAEQCLKALPSLNEGLEEAARRTEATDAARLGLLQARALRSGDDSRADLRDVELERSLSEQLILGIRAPRVSLDAVSASFLGDSLAVAAALARA